MLSDNDIDKAFRRLNPPEPAPESFPLDAWLRLETQLDQAVVARAVRRKLWRYFAAEVAAAALVWMLWPSAHPAAPVLPAATATVATTALTGRSEPRPPAAAGPVGAQREALSLTQHGAAPATTVAPRPTAAVVAASPEAAAAQAPAAAAAPATATPATAGPDADTRFLVRGLPLAAAPTASRRPETAGANATPAADDRASSMSGGERAGLVAGAATPPAEPLAAVPTPTRPPRRRAAWAQHLGTEVGAVARRLAPGRIQVAAPLGPAAADPALETTSGPLTAPEAAAPVALLARTVALSPAPADLPTELAPAVATPSNLPVPVRQPRLYVGVVAAPDFSTVQFAAVQRPALNLGLTLEYRLGQRWRVGTGLFRVPKEYSARRNDYDWAGYPRTYSRNFEWVNASCTVLDLPLNLRYDAVVRPRGRFFGSVGLSSFLLQQERYAYEYTENNQPQTWAVDISNATSNWFSLANASVGYEHALGAHWRWQVEPYLKLPLSGIGAGKVRLTSTGVLFGVKYGF